jgi:hypothetical protein
MSTELAHTDPDSLGDVRPAKKPNPSWFKPGDARINRQGRPKGTKAVKQLSGHLVRLVVPGQYILFRYIRGELGPYMGTYLPPDVKIVDAQFDPERNVVLLTLSHPSFAEVQKGQPLPEMKNWQGRLRCKIAADWLPSDW